MSPEESYIQLMKPVILGKQNSQYKRVLEEEECKYAFKQLLKVISYLQDPSVGVCHRDINPNNIMINHEGYFTSNNTHNLSQIDSSLAVNNSPFLG